MFTNIDKRARNNSLKFLFACYFLYTISICIKMVYSAEMSEIIVAVGSTKSAVSLGLLFYYIAYFVAQLTFAAFISKVNLKWFLTISVSLTAVSFGLMLFIGNLWQLYLILFLNGFFQTGVWGGIMYFVEKYVSKEMSGFASKFLTTGFVIGTALTYGASALFIAILDWRYTFLFFSILTIVSLLVFLWAIKMAEKSLSFVSTKKEEDSIGQEIEIRSIGKKNSKQSIVSLIAFFTLILSLMCCVYYAFMGWFPNLLIEIFDMPSKYSILLTLLLPLSMTPGSFVIVGLNEKSKSDYNVSVLFSVVVVILVIVLSFLYQVNIILTLILSVAMLFFLRALISLISAYVPFIYREKVEVGKFSLILNAFAALAGGVMPYATAFILEEMGWDMYFVALSICSLLFFGLLFIAKIKEKNKRSS